jgi:hypothetical protein
VKTLSFQQRGGSVILNLITLIVKLLQHQGKYCQQCVVTGNTAGGPDVFHWLSSRVERLRYLWAKRHTAIIKLGQNGQ